MFTVYILKSNSVAKTYVGYTNNLERRFQEHNSGQVPFTKRFLPWQVIYTESSDTEYQAKKRERYWKSGAGRRKMKVFFSV